MCVFQTDADWFLGYLVDVLEHETQPSVRFLAEWSLVRLVLHSSSLLVSLLNILTQVYFVHLLFFTLRLIVA